MRSLFLPGLSKSYNRAFIVICVLAIVLPLLFHHRHDYGAFVVIWRVILSGVNPWLYENGVMTGNSYGPLFNVFALFYGIHTHLPHLIFILSWLGLSTYLLRKVDSFEEVSKKDRIYLFWFLLLNPFFWVEIVSYGHFDIKIQTERRISNCLVWAF